MYRHAGDLWMVLCKWLGREYVGEFALTVVVPNRACIEIAQVVEARCLREGLTYVRMS